MATTYHFAVDLGATSGRTILASFDGAKVELEQVSRFANPMLPVGGHIFWNLPGLYSEILDGLKKAAAIMKERNASIETIGIDTWGCDVAYFHPNGAIAGLPFCYRDTHTIGAIDRFCESMPRETVYAKTGIQFMDFNTLFQLDTIHRHSPEIVKGADKILFVPDSLSYMLTGNAVTERTVASTSQFLDPNTGELDAELLATAGVEVDQFGKLVNPGEVIGTLTPEVQRYTGLGAIPVVAVAGHDTASAVIAVPTPDRDYAYLSCGTWSLLGVEIDRPVINEKTRAYNFTNEGGLDRTIRFLKNICGMWIFEQCRREWGDTVTPDVGKLSSLCEESDCASIINPDDPSFANPSSMIAAIVDYCKATSQAIPEAPADFVRVIFRSLAKRYKEVLSMLTELVDIDIKRLHVIGGGSLNKYLMQYTADELQMPVIAGPTECTALGNVLVQLRAAGHVDTLNAMRQIAINSTETKQYLPK
ncbi:MAG: rhamnulokinase [Clostridiales bacterium]|nr:rhamnulokinase [Clostridiales bacterium]